MTKIKIKIKKRKMRKLKRQYNEVITKKKMKNKK